MSYSLLLLSHGQPSIAVIAVAVWGLAFSAIPLSVQSAVLRVVHEGVDTASAVIVVAFQIGIGGGALFGGALIDAGHLMLLPWIGLITVVDRGIRRLLRAADLPADAGACASLIPADLRGPLRCADAQVPP